MTYEEIQRMFNQQFQYSTWFTSDGGFSNLTSDEMQLLKVIKKEATQYYKAELGLDLTNQAIRELLTTEQSERIVEFMKNRLKWYNENGFLLQS